MKNCSRHNSSESKNPSNKVLWLIPLSGFIALIWFLVRVIPKPSRALYPCQRAATPLASGFVAWIIGSVTGLFPSVIAFNQGKKNLRQARFAGAFLLFAAAGGLFGSFALFNSPNEDTRAADAPFVPEAVNQPLGVGKGINPGRVTWVHDPNAVTPTGKGYWWSDANVNQAEVDTMVTKTLLWLTGKATEEEAWVALFKSFNNSYGNGDTGYQEGEKIAIKVNMNSSASAGWTNEFCTSPQVTYAVVSQLIEKAGVPGSAITVYDASRGIGNPVFNKIRANTSQDYQDVTFVVSPAKPGTGRINAVHDPNVAIHFAEKEMQDADSTFLPTCVTEASYLINLGQLKGHNLAGVTLCAKNFFGSLYRPTNPDSTGQWRWTPTGTDENTASNVIEGTNPKVGPGMHGIHGYMNPFYVNFWYLASNSMGSYNSLVDLIGNKNLGGKVMLNMIDGLYSAPEQSNNIVKWTSAPFNNKNPSSILASQDVIALESVCIDFMLNEPNVKTNLKGSLDNYLHEGALADNPPSGTFYDPEGDGTRLASLGVHEHWNNATDKLYSKNMGTGNGIELVRAPSKPANLVATAGEGFVDLSWDACVVTDSYTVKRSEVSNGEYTVIAANLEEPTYSDTEITAGTTYYYVVSASNVYDESFNSSEVSAVPETPVAVKDEPTAYPLSLSCNPNPFNSSARISYSLPKNGKVTLQIYNMLGQKVAMLVNNHVNAGNHSYIWNGRNDNGETVSSGMYLVHLNSLNGSLTRKIVLLY